MSSRMILASLCVLCVLRGESPAPAAEPGPWATYRGNPQRIGHTDNTPGPDKPAVLWAVKSQDHFVAAPVPVGDAGSLLSLESGLRTQAMVWSGVNPFRTSFGLAPASTRAIASSKWPFITASINGLVPGTALPRP